MADPDKRLRQASSNGSFAGPTGLPTVLSELLPRRIAFTAALYAIIFALNVVPYWVKMLFGTAMQQPSHRHIAGLASIALGIGVFFAARARKLPERWLNGISLGFLIVSTFGIAVSSIDPHFPKLDQPVYIGLPWTALYVALYPVTMPMRPLHAILGGLGAIAATAAGMQLNVMMAPDVSGLAAPIWIGLAVSMAICVGWGVAVSYTLYRLGRQVSRERQRGSYHLEKLLGEGGMGEVWYARHRMLARPAAVKIIRPDALSGDEPADVTLRRFEREAQATASLESPHAVALYDFGLAEDGSFYYVMEYLRGVDLQTLIERHGPVEAGRAIHWLRQACHSLSEAHARGLLHRDIKPANLYACEFSQRHDFLKVLDFGLVKHLDDAEGDETQLTRETAVAGTPAFLPPEIATGEPDVDGRADLYALGCVGYWLVTGRLVFEHDRPMKMMLAHINDEVVPPSQRSELEIPADFEAVLLDCLAKKPADRPPSADALIERLDACASAHDWTPERARRWWDVHHPERGESPEELADDVSAERPASDAPVTRVLSPKK